MVRKTILIVDDSDSICSGIASYLEVHGYDALTAYDGERGVRVARTERPDVILLDIMMPVMDGWEAIRQLKSYPETARIPILALSALRLSADQVSAAGFDGYLSKPVPPHRLIDEIDRVTPQVRAR
jgi:two-component system, cell cycle response regulator DivK